MAVVLASGLGLAGAFADTMVSVDSRGDTGQPVAALVAHAPEWLRGEAAQRACPIGWEVMERCLQAGGLVAFTISAGSGPLACDRAVQSLRSQVGEDRRLGLVCWGEIGALPGMRALGSAVDVLAMLDQVDALDQVKAASALYHFADRRSPAARHAIERQLSAIERTGRSVTYHWYHADPGFAAPDGHQADRTADLVWRRTAAFLRHHLDQSAPERTMATGWLGA
jgi:hypothetical protein